MGVENFASGDFKFIRNYIHNHNNPSIHYNLNARSYRR
jgi:hypothetical protein